MMPDVRGKPLAMLDIVRRSRRGVMEGLHNLSQVPEVEFGSV